MENTAKPGESFRDSISTVSEKGKRVWIYPKKPKGGFTNARTIVSIALLAVLFAAPFIKIGGHPFFLFNVIERKFILFGMMFGPQDFYLFVLAMITAIIFIVLFTAVFGRIFCGWICPQTVFMEMVFRKIEYLIEGDASKQKALDKAPFSAEKFFKKGTKHVIFYLISFLIGNTLLAYIVGVDELLKIVNSSPLEHLSLFIAIVLFSGLFYFIFARFREQACVIVCPYGRLQGVLLDRNSIVVAYDNVRGEPRKKIKKNEERTAGDCIDCGMCVDVCPTGIDIRNGIQLECVNCTACIDACNTVMTKINKPKGLIRYDSLRGITEKTGKIFTPRVMAYSALLVILLTIITVLLANRKEVEVNILRTPGLLYQELPDNKISNLYNVEIENKTFDKIPVEIKLIDRQGEIKIIGRKLEVESQGVFETKFLLIFNRDSLKDLNTPVTLGIYKGETLLKTIKTSFLGIIKDEEK
jgi:cytochrome c oxidase accessory protein FixG